MRNISEILDLLTGKKDLLLYNLNKLKEIFSQIMRLKFNFTNLKIMMSENFWIFFDLM